MPRKKKNETITAAVVEAKSETAEDVKESVVESSTKAESVTEAVKETVSETLAEKSVKKPVAKKTPAKKIAAKTKTPSKTVEKKTTANTTKAAVPVETVKLQFGSDEYDLAEIKKAVEADYKGKFKGRVITVEIYVKPEDKAAYYVVNSDFSDKIEL